MVPRSNTVLSYNFYLLHFRNSFNDNAVVGEPVPTVVNFKILPTDTQCGKPLLTVHDGFTYTVRRQSEDATSWRCSNRKCSGTVRETLGTFEPTVEHNHQSNPGIHLKIEIKAKVTVAS